MVAASMRSNCKRIVRIVASRNLHNGSGKIVNITSEGKSRLEKKEALDCLAVPLGSQ